ncbi:MAG: hypothetical protein ABR924_13430 [Terracidiphilus sp.]|jgi:hypothetical protein
MTLMDAPVFDEARERRRQRILFGSGGLLLALLIGWWLVAGRPVDLPWNWNSYLMGRSAANRFLTAVEQNDLPKAYGIWRHDQDWQHHAQDAVYPYSRFQDDWSSTSPANEYGAIQSHQMAAARMYGNVLLMAVLINGRKSKPLNLTYDPKTHTLSFAPDGVGLYLGP